MGVPRVEDLLRVRRADGCHAVRGFNRTLHQVDTIVIFQDMVLRLRDAEHVFDQFFAIFPLVLDVMDGDNRLDATVPLVVRIEDAVIDRHKGGLPIVAMDDVRLKVDIGQHLQCSAREECKALRVVIVAVKPLALKIILIVDQIVNHATGPCLEYTAILTPPCHRHGQAGDKAHVVAQLLRDLFIQRHHDAAANQPFAQCLGQGARHVRQTARSGKRPCLTGTIQYFHI